MSTVIKVENLSKQYRLGEIGTGTISHDLNRWWHKVRGKEDPYLKIGEANDRTAKGISDYVWALQDINFEVKQGEVLGIIGRNGAGKSTLLKILSKTTTPTTGSIKVKGRIASLLEVGTGFHPELSGRDNIFLNGAILGMTKKEIKSKFDEIVDFSGVERYIDTPVKRYSSGMYVRLAFAVAAHLEPEILIVDEVLAVGDVEFQKKCLGKMKDVSVNDGRTVLFVSHNMAAVKSLCNAGLLLINGKVANIGAADICVSEYLHRGVGKSEQAQDIDLVRLNDILIHSLYVHAKDLEQGEPITTNDEIHISINYTIYQDPEKYHLTFHMHNEMGEAIFSFSHYSQNLLLNLGSHQLNCIVPAKFLNTGAYYLTLYIVKDKQHAIHVEKDICTFNVQDSGKELGTWMGREPGDITPQFKWIHK